MEHLIANSGIHFIVTEREFNPAEQLAFQSGKTLKYAFCETSDFITGEQIFDLLYYHSQDGVYIPLDELRQSGKTEKRPNGRDELDDAGLIKMQKNESTALFTSYQDGDAEVFNINSLAGYRVKLPNDNTIYSAFDLLLDKWLPMPMFEKEIDGVTSADPFTWCRVKIQCIGEGSKKGCNRYRFLWAFDTTLGNIEPTATPSNIISFSEDYDEGRTHFKQPYFYDDECDHKEFCLCNRADELLDFMSVSDYFSAFSDYISSLLGQHNRTESRKYVGYYIYLINYIRCIGAAPDVTLHNNQRKTIDVDMVLDIGNSRTCGVLFEEGDFTKAVMLEVRDLTHPEISYEKSFDMRVAFRKADFGNDIVLDDGIFEWRSLVRVGDEAKHLVYRSLEEDGMSERTTNYSSPKRYLWDMKPYDGRWEFLTSIDDPSSVKLAGNIYIPGLTDQFDHTGNFIGPDGEDNASDDNSYSRSALMTFVFIEILQQAQTQINSIKFRTKHGNMDCRRNLRNIIITCPTAMPVVEQIKLRQCAEDAINALVNCSPALGRPTVIPTSASLRVKDDDADPNRRMWSFDEASCCQLVYLYAEIAQRYSGEIHKFFDLKGHVRPEEKEEGYEGKSLTIGSIDIGAGTTDVMICSYQCKGEGRSKVTPIPLYWDSFYLAGDEILHNIVQNQVIEGKDLGLPNMGNVFSALWARMKDMTNDELQQLSCLKESTVYKGKVYDIVNEPNEERRKALLKALASNLLHDFFGQDSAMMSHHDRRCRVDFNTQISVPIAQTYLEHLRRHRPTRVFTFDDLFGKLKPADYLLDYFEQHFGFSFKELSWRFDPQEIAAIVKNTMEPLMKQLSVVLYAHHCDILILAGRPSSLDAITELFIKYIPIAPDRLIRLNDYRVGSWYPFADGQGYFYDQKSVVAVGGMVGYLAANQGFNGLSLDFSRMIKQMKSTAHYIGHYNSRRQQVAKSILTPINGSATIDVAVFPAFLGCKQFDSALYQARPLYAIYNYSSHHSLRITLSRNYYESRESLMIEEVIDEQGNSLPKREVELVLQSLVDDGKYWLDKGEFELSVN